MVKSHVLLLPRVAWWMHTARFRIEEERKRV
jgi:hypothetical protein